MSDERPNSPIDQSLTTALPRAEPIPASAIDPRDQMAIQLLARGHATIDEAMHATFGEWPPRGLEIGRANTNRIDFVGTGVLHGEASPDGRLPLGLATVHGRRQMWINPDETNRSTGLIGSGGEQVSNIFGHETAHITQGDHQARAADYFGRAAQTEILAARTSGFPQLIADSVFGRHTDEARRQSAIAQKVELTYLTDGLEIQARVHQILAQGYPQWSRFPQNREEFLVALHGSGVQLSQQTLEDLQRSPTYAQTRRDFPSVPSGRAEEINAVRNILTDSGQRIFERDSLPRMYGDLLEMYGDRLGRERFGFGVNEYQQIRDATPDQATNRANGFARDFTFKPNGAGAEIYTSQFGNAAYLEMRSALKERDIRYSILEEGSRDERFIVNPEDMQKLRDLQQDGHAGYLRSLPTPDFSFKPTVTGVEIHMSQMTDAEDYNAMHRALRQQGINFRVIDEGGKDERILVDTADLDKLRDMKRQAHSNHETIFGADQRFINQFSLQRAENGEVRIPLINIRSASIEALVTILERERIVFREDHANGQTSLVLDEANARRFRGIKAEIQMARPIAADPTSSDYHLQMASMRAQQELGRIELTGREADMPIRTASPQAARPLVDVPDFRIQQCRHRCQGI